MKGWLSLTALLYLAAWSCGTASAQIEQNDLSISAEVTLLSYQVLRAEGTRGPRDEIVEKTSDFEVGPGVGQREAAGLKASYAVTRYMLPSLYLAFQRRAYDMTAELNGDENQHPYGATGTSVFVQVRPSLEIAFLPKARWVPFGLAGVALFAGGGSLNYAPTIGGGIHGFVMPKVSLDGTLLLRSVLGLSDDRDTLAQGGSVNSEREYSVLLSGGVSFWI